VTFTGSKGNDRFDVAALTSVTITGGTGNNAYVVNTETAIITNSDGNNRYDVTVTVAAEFTVGNGNNEFDLKVEDGQAAIKAGNGNNKISAGKADAVVIDAGAGDNTVVPGAGATTPTGDWEGFQGSDILDLSVVGDAADITSINDPDDEGAGPDLGGIATVEFDNEEVVVTLTAAQHAVLADGDVLNAANATLVR
jgi:hypothetical protein